MLNYVGTGFYMNMKVFIFLLISICIFILTAMYVAGNKFSIDIERMLFLTIFLTVFILVWFILVFLLMFKLTK